MKLLIGLIIYTLILLADGRPSTHQHKPINKPLVIPCECQDVSSLCHWHYNDQRSVPDHWVQSVNGDLNLPADDWSVYGIITSQCGSDYYTYTIDNPGNMF